MATKILILMKPTDEQPALERAADYAHFAPEIEVVLCRIFNKFTNDNKATLESQANAMLERYRRTFPVIQNMSLKVIFDSDVAGSFNHEAETGGYDLAVISGNSRNTIRDLFVSPLDSRIMRDIQLPLVVVKDGKAPLHLSNALLLAIDFSSEKHALEVDEYLYEAARLFCDRFGGEIFVANCIPPTHGALRSRELDIPNPSYDMPSRHDVQEQLLREFADRHKIKEDHIFMLKGRVDEEIPRVCNLIKARMVCMGHQGDRGFFGALDSDASEIVLEQTNGDLFTVNIHLARRVMDEYERKHTDNH